MFSDIFYDQGLLTKVEDLEEAVVGVVIEEVHLKPHLAEEAFDFYSVFSGPFSLLDSGRL